MSWRLFLATSIVLAACEAQPLSVIVSLAGDWSGLLSLFVSNTNAIDRLDLPNQTAVFSRLSVATYLVAEPDNRETGDLPMASGVPNPEVEFAIVDITPHHSQTEFVLDGHQPDTENAGRLRPFLFLHLDLYARPYRLACQSAESLSRSIGLQMAGGAQCASTTCQAVSKAFKSSSCATLCARSLNAIAKRCRNVNA